jgi:hypothetical protein
VVHVSPVPRTSAEQRAELHRIFGQEGILRNVSPLGKTPEELVAEIRRQAPSAIFLDTVGPPYTRPLRALSNETVVLEAIFEREQPYRGGPPPRRVVGIGRRNERGEVERVPDGALGRERELLERQQRERDERERE